jgi:transmembrane sensor
MNERHSPDWPLIQAIARQTATPEEQARWQEYIRQYPDEAGLPDFVRETESLQQDPLSPFYAREAFEQLRTRLKTRERPGLSRIIRITAVAATIGGLLFFVSQFFHGVRHEQPIAVFRTYTVPNGSRQLFILPDSSKLWVNAGSTVRIPAAWSDSSRDIDLEGEGFFDVRPDTRRPFLVHTPLASVRVLGTSFDVHAYPLEAAAVTVVTGKVLVRSGISGEQRVVSLGNRAILGRDGHGIEMAPTSSADYMQWTMGRIQFNDCPLAEAIGDLERRFNIRIEISGDSRGLYCTGKYSPDETAENILKSLGDVYNYRLTGTAGRYQIHLPHRH